MTTLFSLALAMMLAVGTVAAAQMPATADKSTPTKAVRSVSGTVRSSSPDTVVISGRDKGRDTEWTFAVETTTNIRKGTKSIVPGDLKAGDPVQVRFVEQEGKAIAKSILVRTSRKDAKKPDAK